MSLFCVLALVLSFVDNARAFKPLGTGRPLQTGTRRCFGNGNKIYPPAFEFGKSSDRLTMVSQTGDFSVSFSHVQIFVDHIDSLEVYKQFEDSLNKFHSAIDSKELTLEEKRRLWNTIIAGEDGELHGFVPQNRDIVKQLMAGFGFRVTAYRFPSTEIAATTNSLLVTSRDLNGVQILVSSLANATDIVEDELIHFDAGK